MKKIMIVECISSSVNYIKDIYDEGYEPVLLEVRYKGFERLYMRKAHEHELDVMLDSDISRPSIYTAKRQYKDTLKMVKDINPILIIPGSDAGIELATHLSHDLGLTGNNPENLPKMRNKYIAQQALKDNNLRYINSKIVSDIDEATAFYNELKKQNKKMVAKPISGISSLCVYIINNENDLKKAMSNNQGVIGKRFNGGYKNSMLLQEYIDGEEYAFNSISSKGKHRTVLICNYHKILSNGRKIYDYEKPVKVNSEEYKLIDDYGNKVLDAIKFEYGASHCEIMVDNNGPVLIEANCRLYGANNKYSFQDESRGFHESKESLLSYLYPEKYINEYINKEYELIKPYLIKFIIQKNSAFSFKLNLNEVFKNFASYRGYCAHREFGYLPKTVDLASSPAFLFFVGKNNEELDTVLNFIKDIENNNQSIMYSGFTFK